MSDDLLKQLLEYRGELYGFIRAIVRQHHAAEDLFQEVALIIVRKADAKPDIQHFPAWAKEIARRKIWEYYRGNRNRKELNLPTEEMAETICEIYEDPHMSHDEVRRQQEALRQCSGKLTPELREMLQLRHAQDENYAEIAVRFRKTEAAVRRAVSRARLAVIACVRRCLAQSELGA